MEEDDAARAHTLLLDVLRAQHDLASARQRFEHDEAIVGSDTWLPRQNVLKLLARPWCGFGVGDTTAGVAGPSAADAAHLVRRLASAGTPDARRPSPVVSGTTVEVTAGR